jgi:hypothetical protein
VVEEMVAFREDASNKGTLGMGKEDVFVLAAFTTFNA